MTVYDSLYHTKNHVYYDEILFLISTGARDSANKI